ncbi:MAG TPA: hypothetical protein VGE55_01025 [Limnobacter sp.]|uniref:hypothetical protein n=1 Tax=Limnobacter sp. TaxID=2003368 RepID=UPI002ED8ACCE
MIISKLRAEWLYISGRIAALLSRPVMLLALKHWGGNDLAATVAVVFLVTMLASAVSGFDTHRGFYQAYFGDRRVKGFRPSYRLYCGATTLQVAVVSPLLALFVLYRFGDPALAALVAVYFASERLADEAQRFLIFTGHRQEWGGRIMAKAVLQLAGASAAAVLLGPGAAHLAVGSLLVGNFAAYGSKLPWRYLPVQWSDWKAGAASCLSQRLFWLLSMVTSFISYLDRVVVMLFQQTDMAVYTLMVSSMSIVQNAVDYFFVSLRRREILQGQLSLSGVFRNRRFYLTLGIASLAGCVASWVMLRLYHGQQMDHLELVPVVLLSQTALSVTLVLREIIYWNHSVQRLVWQEGSFIACTLAAASALRELGQSYEVVLGMISVFFTLRMGLMIWGISRAKKQAPIT